jgi:hypothetical protein
MHSPRLLLQRKSQRLHRTAPSTLAPRQKPRLHPSTLAPCLLLQRESQRLHRTTLVLEKPRLHPKFL